MTYRPSPHSRFLFPLALASIALCPNPAFPAGDADRGTPIITVGPGVDCTESSLTTAINNAPSGAEIRLVNVTFSGVNIGIVDKNLSVIGGFEACSASSPDFSSTLDGTGNGGNTVVDVFSATSSTWSVRLENLNIVNGAETSPFERGGGLQVEDGNDVELVDVSLRDNASATDGGAIQVRGAGSSVTISGDSLITDNDAPDGGGIACIGGSGPALLIIDRGSIFQNTAARGGGVFADSCTVETRAGGFLQGIFANQATTSGGGIAALGNSFVQVLGGGESAALVVDNIADSRGGGVWALEGSDVEVIDGIIAGNTADRGGGVDVSTGASFFMRRGDGNDCGGGQAGSGNAPCPRLRDNRARLVGGGFAVSDGIVDIAQTFLSGNTADLNGSVGEITSGAATISSSVLFDNPGNQLLRQFGDSALTVRWSTFADNVPDTGTPPLIEVRGATSTPATTRLWSNIAWNPGRPVYGVDTGGGSLDDIQADCLVAHELTSLPAASRSSVADPLFVDAVADDYHLQIDSPAIDFCDDSVSAPAFADLDDQARGVDVVPGGFTFDVGADENLGVVFVDGFESS